jgi:hypothetical protein
VGDPRTRGRGGADRRRRRGRGAQTQGKKDLPEPEGEPIELEQRTSTSFSELARTIFGRYPRRAGLGFALLSTQAFLYNAVLFSSTLILTNAEQESLEDIAEPLSAEAAQ